MRTANLSLLSYNLKFHAAYAEVADLAAEYTADIVCLQECFAKELHKTLGDLRLAAKTTTGELGLALYCRSPRFSVVTSTSHPLPLSLYERVRPEVRERLLIVELQDHIAHTKILVGILHATHLVATNQLRRQQIRYALSVLNDLSQDAPVILVGDYNYPFFHRRLNRFVRKHGYQLAKGDGHTFKNDFFMGKFDFASVANVASAQVEALPYGVSDHAPVLLRTALRSQKQDVTKTI